VSFIASAPVRIGSVPRARWIGEAT
jgi:hypothetical protein